MQHKYCQTRECISSLVCSLKLLCSLLATIKIKKHRTIVEITENQTADSFPVCHPAELQIFWLALLLGRPSGWRFILVLKTVGTISRLVCAP